MPLALATQPPAPSAEETALAERAVAGDAEAFGELAERTWPSLVRLARVALAGDPEAEDVAQEALLVAWRRLGQLRRTERFVPWLRRIAWREALRAARARRELPLLDTPMPDRSESPSPDRRIDVERHLARLTPRERAVVYLSEVEGKTAAEIGAELGIAAATARVHRWHARRRLGALLEEAP